MSEQIQQGRQLGVILQKSLRKKNSCEIDKKVQSGLSNFLHLAIGQIPT